ncbi:MAG: hypothetical protein WCJ57_02205, partial [Candidatus Falkowbacteria bacterium]
LDDDDIWSDKEKLDKQILYLDNNPDCILIGTQYSIANNNRVIKDKSESPLNDKDLRRVMLAYNPFCHSSVVFRKNDNKYNENLNYTEDWDLWLRLGRLGKLAVLDDVMVQYFYGEGMSSRNKKKDQIKFHFRIFRKYIMHYPNRLSAIISLVKYIILG